MAEVALTTPATEMSNHHGKEFLGLGTCTPPTVVPSRFVRMLFYPRVKSKNGKVVEAPYGLRNEEILIEERSDFATVMGIILRLKNSETIVEIHFSS